MTMKRRQCSTAGRVTVGLRGFTPLSVSAMAPVERHIIPVYEKVAPATVLLPSVSVPEHPLAGGRRRQAPSSVSKDEPQRESN